LGVLIKSPGYKSLNDEQKKKAIQSVMTKTRKITRANLDLSKPTKIPSIKGTYTLINKETGTVKNIDLSKSIEYPKLTGNKIMDKKLISSYKSSITSRIRNVVALYQDGQITLDQATKIVNNLQTRYNKTKKGKKAKKPKKLSIGQVSRGSTPKIPVIRSSNGLKLQKVSVKFPKKLQIRQNVGKINLKIPKL